MAEQELQRAVVLFAEAVLLAARKKTQEAEQLFRQCTDIRQNYPGNHLSIKVAPGVFDCTQGQGISMYVQTFNWGISKSNSHLVKNNRQFYEYIERQQDLSVSLSLSIGPVSFSLTGDLTMVQKSATSITIRSNTWSGRGRIVIHTISGDITGEIIVGPVWNLSC